jgi:tetratricopeptide (TPR) repeat protein/uncharacterized membrane protein
LSNKYKAFINRGEYDKLKDFIIKKEGINYENLWYLLDTLLELNKVDEVIKYLDEWKNEIKKRSDLKLWFYFCGIIAFERSNYDIAKEYLLFASIILHEKDDKITHLKIDNQLAMIDIQKGRLPEAFIKLLKLADEFIKYGESLLCSQCLYEIGNIFLIKGFLDNSFRFFNASLNTSQVLKNQKRIGHSNLQLGVVSYFKGYLQKAVSYYNISIKIYNKINDEISLAVVLLRLGDVLRDQGHFNQALVHYENALGIYQRNQITVSIAYALMKIGTLCQQLNKSNWAYNYMESGLSYFYKLGNPRLIAAYIFKLVQVTKDLGTLTDDFEWLAKFPPIEQYKSNNVIKAYNYMVNALLAENKKNWGMAEENWSAALKISGLPFSVMVDCQESLLKIALWAWIAEKTEKSFNAMIKQVEEFEQLCKKKNLSSYLCKVYLIRSKIASVELKPQEAIQWLELCKSVADISALDLYYTLADKELNIINKRTKDSIKRQEIEAKEQLRELEGYISKLNQYVENLLIKDLKLRKREFLIDETKETKTLNEHHEVILELLRVNPLGLFQKDLPYMTNLSQSTISRRINDLLEMSLVQRIPQGRAMIVRLKEYFV